MPHHPRILIVEDNPADVRLIREALRLKDIQPNIEHLETAQAGVQRVKTILSGTPEVPDLILLDYNLPGGTATDVLIAIQGNAAIRGVPKAVLTCSVAPRDKEQALSKGADFFVYKPADLDEFLENVGAALVDALRIAPVGS